MSFESFPYIPLDCLLLSFTNYIGEKSSWMDDSRFDHADGRCECNHIHRQPATPCCRNTGRHCPVSCALYVQANTLMTAEAQGDPGTRTNTHHYRLGITDRCDVYDCRTWIYQSIRLWLAKKGWGDVNSSNSSWHGWWCGKTTLSPPLIHRNFEGKI
jgi:hypothetical protein